MFWRDLWDKYQKKLRAKYGKRTEQSLQKQLAEKSTLDEITLAVDECGDYLKGNFYPEIID